MKINLSNKRKPIEDGATENVLFSGYEIYDSERSASTNVRLMCNVGVVSDGSLFNPITEVVGKDKNNETALKIGTDNINEETLNENIKFGADVFNMPCMRLKVQPFLTNQQVSVDNFSRKNPHYVKRISGFNNVNSIVDGFMQITGNISKVGRHDYNTLEKTYKNKFFRNCGSFGFANPVSMRYNNNNELVDYNNGNGVLKGKPGEFIELYPNKELFSYAPVYSTINQELEYNWLTYVTYPAKNVYDTKYLNKLSDANMESNLLRYGIKIWCVDESDPEITYFRTILRNGFSVGDIVNLYSGQTKIIESFEIVEKPDEYTFAINMGGTKLLSWNHVLDIPEDTEYETYYYNSSNVLTKYIYYEESGDTKDKQIFAPYSNELSVVRVDNQAECMYYIRMFKPFNNRPIIKQNAFSKNVYGVDETSVIFIDDIDISKYTDNLGRPLSDIYLTSIKNNEGYGKWYSYSNTGYDTTGYTKHLTESRAFGEVNGSFVMDDFACDTRNNPTPDAIHINSIQNLKTGAGRVILTERINAKNSEVDNGEFYGDFCEYSPNSFKERILQSYMHRFNTAQRESYTNTKRGELKQALIGRDYYPNFRAGDLSQTRHGAIIGNIVQKVSNYIKNATNGYYYQPHQRIRIRTYGLDLTTADAITYKVLDPTSNGAINFEYGGIKVSGYSCTLSVERIDDIALNSPLILYYMDNSLNISEDMAFSGKMINRYDETLFEFMLDDKLLKTDLNSCVEKVINNKGKFFVLRKPSDVPSHAILSKDRSFTFTWRELIPNGYDRDSGVEEYPFANNAFYVEKNINLYLRRQRRVEYGNENYKIVDTENGDFNYLPESEDIETIETTASAFDYEDRIKEAEEC